MFRWLAALGLLLLALGAWFVVRREGVERGPAREEPRAVTAVAEQPLAPTRVTAPERSALEQERAESAARVEDDDEAAEEDPPTPERPGPGQALLHVWTVALETGKPLAGVSLGLRPLDYEEEHDWKSSTQSDPARGLENDDVRTRADGSGEFIVEAGFGYGLHGRGEDGLADEAELELGVFAAGEERAVTLALATRWTHDWVGRVIDADSELPLVGVEVVVGVPNGDLSEGFVPLAQGTSGTDGRVRLLLPAWQSSIARCRSAGYAAGGARVLRREDEGDEPQLLRLHRFAALTLVVLESEGPPAPVVEVRVSVPEWQLFEDVFLGSEDPDWGGTTDALGQCTFAELPSGCELFVTLQKDGWTLAWTGQISDALKLAPGEHRRIEWRLPGKGRIEGRLVDPQGAPLAEVPIVVAHLGAGLERSRMLPFFQENLLPRDSLPSSGLGGFSAGATTDAVGRFQVAAVPVGAYHVGVDEESGEVSALGKVVVVREGETASLELVLERGLWIEGKLLDARGEPAWGVGISCTGEGDSRQFRRASCSTEEDGSFSLGPLLSGPYRVRSSAGEGEHDAPIEELVVDAGTRGLELTLRLGGTITVEFEGLAEDEEADVFVRAENAPWSGGSMDRLAPGRYDLHAYSDEGKVGVLRGFVIEAGRDHQVTLPLTPGATLHLTEPGAGSDISSFRVFVDGALIPWFDHFDRSTALPPGHVRIEAQAWTLRGLLETIATRERDLAAGETWSVSFSD